MRTWILPTALVGFALAVTGAMGCGAEGAAGAAAGGCGGAAAPATAAAPPVLV
jgi:hypothetical protein